MASKYPLSQGRRTPLTLTAQPKQQVSQGTKRQQEHHTKDERKEPVANSSNNTNSSSSSAAATKDAANSAKPKNGADVVIGNGNSNVVANGSNKSANSNVAQEITTEKKETRNRAVKQQQQQQQQQSAKNDSQQSVKNVASKNGVDNAAAKTTPSPSPSPRKQQPKQEQQQQPQQQVGETKVSTPSAASTKKPVEEKVAISKQQSAQKEVKPAGDAPAVGETTSKPAEKPPVVDEPKTVVDVADESETRSSSVKDVKQADVQSKTESPKLNSVEKPANAAKTATPTKSAEIIAVSSDSSAKENGSSVVKQSVTSCIDVDDNGEVMMNVSPTKKVDQQLMAPPALIHDNPNATSTPGKINKMLEVHTPDNRGGGEIHRPVVISARRSIRPKTEWTPLRFENSQPFGGYYRRIKTDLDNSMDTNTSLNVTVGSEPDDNNSSWFSFRSRKRERTPNNVESVKEAMMSPPKRARFGGILSVMASPLTALRTRFSKTSIHNNVVEKLSGEKNGLRLEDDNNDDVKMIVTQDEVDVQESKVENISPDVKENELENNNSPQKEQIVMPENEKSSPDGKENNSDLVQDDMADIAITETSLVNKESTNDVLVKRSCNVM